MAQFRTISNSQVEKSSINYFSAGFQKTSALQAQNLDSASTLGTFRAQFQQEFTQGSAIDHALYASSIRIVADTEQLPGGEASAPIHDALNKKLMQKQLKRSIVTIFFKSVGHFCKELASQIDKVSLSRSDIKLVTSTFKAILPCYLQFFSS